MNKNKFAENPPMGWNSYDYYDTMVTEDDVKLNADYMASYLKDSGWEYVVVDIGWYSIDAGTQRDKYQYVPFGKVEIDEYSRLVPCIDRFPSAAYGKGFKPLADYVHNLGLKFGIHIMRGIPRIAAHNHMKIVDSDYTADQIADPNSICSWNPDMYGVRPEEEGAQKYYDSIVGLYARWGVDFIKCDDICRMDMPSARKEIEMLHKAIENCGRPMVLSLSPGPARIEDAWHYAKYANMWRITDDFWDNWESMLHMFEQCEKWQRHATTGCFPDCDMLPVGWIGKGFGEERETNFTKDEQITMMTLWCICRSPLMLGCDLPKLDPWTLKMITKKEVLRMLTSSKNARQIERDQDHVVWCADDVKYNSIYLAVFNLQEQESLITVDLGMVDGFDFSGKRGFELWSAEEKRMEDDFLEVRVSAHGAKVYKII